MSDFTNHQMILTNVLENKQNSQAISCSHLSGRPAVITYSEIISIYWLNLFFIMKQNGW